MSALQKPSIADWQETNAVGSDDSLLLHRPGPAGSIEEYRISIAGVLDGRYVLVPGGTLAAGRIIGTNNAGGGTQYALGAGIAFAGGNLVANGQDHLGYNVLSAFDPAAELIVNSGGQAMRMPAAFLGSSGFLAPFASADAAGIVKPATDGFIVGPFGALGLAVGPLFGFSGGRLILNVGPGLTSDGGTLAPALGASLGLVNGAIALQDLAFSGDVSGSGNSAIALTLPTITAPGTFTKITVDGKGRVTLGAAFADTDVTNALGFAPLQPAQVGAAGGLATLDASKKLNAAQIPDALTTGFDPQGTWNPVTNTPSLAAGVGTNGLEYIAAAAGTQDIGCTNLVGAANSVWAIGDIAIYSTGAWHHVPATQVFGSMAVQNSTSIAVQGGTITGQGTVGLSNGDYLTPTLVPDLLNIVTDTSGNIVEATGTDGSKYVQNLIAPASTITAAVLGGDTIGNLGAFAPDFASIITDAAGSIIAGFDTTGVFNLVGVAAGSAVLNSASIAGVASAGSVVVVTDTIQPLAMPDFVWAITDAAGNVGAGLIADGTFAVNKFQVVGSSNIPGGSGSSAPADAIDVTAAAYGAVGDGRTAFLLGTWTNGGATLTIGRYAGSAVMGLNGKQLTITPDANQAGFEIWDQGMPISVVATDGSGVSFATTIASFVDSTTVILTASSPLAITTANVVWPCFQPGDAPAKTIRIEGGNTTLKRQSRGPQPHLAKIATYISPTQVTLSAPFGTAATAQPARIDWGTDNSGAIIGAGAAAVVAGKRYLWFPGDLAVFCAFTLTAAGAGDRSLLTANTGDVTAAYLGTIWIGANVRAVFTDTAGRRFRKAIVPRYMPGPPPPKRTLVARRHLPRFAAAAAPAVIVVGDSLGMDDPNLGQTTAWFDEDLFEGRIREDNPGKAITTALRAIGGGQFNWLVSGGPVPGVNHANEPWYTVPAQPLWNFVQTMPVNGIDVTPDLYFVSNRGGVDFSAIHPLKIQALINRIRALPQSGGLPPDILMTTGMQATPKLPYQMDEALATQRLVRTMAQHAGIGFIDMSPYSELHMFGASIEHTALRYIPGFTATASAAAPLTFAAACYDFSAHFVLTAASGAAAWAAAGTLAIALSPNPGNVLLLDIDPVTGVLRYEVRLWGRAVPTTVTCSGTTVTTAGGTGYTGTLNWTEQQTQFTLGTAPGPFSPASVGQCILLPGADTFGDTMRTFIAQQISDTVAVADDFWWGRQPGTTSINQSCAATIGGMMFIPLDADAQVDIIIPGAGAAGGEYRGKITGYTGPNQVTVSPPISTPLTGAVVNMFLAKISVPRTLTTIAAGTDAGANPVIDVNVQGGRLQVRYRPTGVYSAWDPPRAFIGTVERFGGRFYPSVTPTGSIAITANSLFVDDDVVSMPEATPWELHSYGNNFYAYGGGVSHPSSIMSERVAARILDAQDFAA